MKDKKKNRNIKIVILAVILLLIFLHFLGILKTPEIFIFDSVSNSQGSTYTFFSKLQYSLINFQESQKLKSENEKLQQQLNELLYENSQLLKYEQENQNLKSLLNYVEEKNAQLQVAKVIGRDLNRSNTLIINKGQNYGLAEGYAVIVDKGIIIGTLADVRSNSSTVLLLTDNFSQLTISTVNYNRPAGIVKGDFGLSIKAELIPQDIEINENDLIITSGLEQLIPAGLIIGKVNRITSNENDLFKSANISPLNNYDEITLVSVIIPKIYD